MVNKHTKKILICAAIIALILSAVLFWIFGGCGGCAENDLPPPHLGAYGRVTLALGDIFGLDDSFHVVVTNDSEYRLSGFDFSLQYFDGDGWRLPRAGGRGGLPP